MNLYDLFSPEACAINVRARTREEVLRAVAEAAARTPGLALPPADEIFNRLLEREQQGSTGIGQELAIPHARFEAMDRFVLFIVTVRRGVAFNALDKKKVKVFFVLLGPASAAREHLQILAAVSGIIARHPALKQELLHAQSRTALHEAFMSKTSEERPARAHKKMKMLFVILYEEGFFYDILEFFIEQGLDGATILESSGMGQYISNIPIFASFIGFMNEDKNRSRTLMTLVPEDRLQHIVQGIEAITGDLDRKQGAMLIALDVPFWKGSMKMM